VLPNYSTADAQARAQQYLTSGGLSSGSATINAAVAATTFGTPPKTVNQVTVTVAYPYTYPFIGPILNLVGGSLGSVTLQGVSTMRVEGN
jgi:hypothetical protein